MKNNVDLTPNRDFALIHSIIKSGTLSIKLANSKFPWNSKHTNDNTNTVYMPFIHKYFWGDEKMYDIITSDELEEESYNYISIFPWNENRYIEINSNNRRVSNGLDILKDKPMPTVYNTIFR